MVDREMFRIVVSVYRWKKQPPAFNAPTMMIDSFVPGKRPSLQGFF